MRLVRLVFAVCLVFLIATGLFAQCENGQCRPTPIRNAVATIVQAQPVRAAARGVYESVSSVRQSCGSSGSQSYGSSGSAAFRVGGHDHDGAPIQWIGVGAAVEPEKNGEVSSMWFGRKKSRQVITESVEKAVADGSMESSQADAIKRAIRSPRMLSRVEDLIAQQAKASGAYVLPLDRNGDVVISAINWEQIGDFILKIAPIIFKLIEMFVAYEDAGDVMGMAMVLDNLDYLATVHWRSRLAC
jgi:hypothetical protein